MIFYLQMYIQFSQISSFKDIYLNHDTSVNKINNIFELILPKKKSYISNEYLFKRRDFFE